LKEKIERKNLKKKFERKIHKKICQEKWQDIPSSLSLSISLLISLYSFLTALPGLRKEKDEKMIDNIPVNFRVRPFPFVVISRP